MISETDSSLLDTGEVSFYLLNRGILLSAKDVSFNNYSNELTISFENCEVHGNVDGGHTYRTILQYRDQLDQGQQYVKIEILTGIEGIFQSLAAARNTSVQVQDKFIADRKTDLTLLKTLLPGKPIFLVYFSRRMTPVISMLLICLLF